jgi:inner membrane protein
MSNGSSIRVPTRSLGLKFLLVCALALIMFVPIGFVMFVQADRQSRWNSAISEVGGAEGGQQTVVGPILLVPYTKQIEGSDGKAVTIRNEAVVFPETGTAKVVTDTTVRTRGMYEVPVYEAQVDLAAVFDPVLAADALAKMDPAARFDLANARLAMGVSNFKGLRGDTVEFITPGDGRLRLEPVDVGGVPVGAAAVDPGYAGVNLSAVAAGALAQTRAPFEIKTSLKLSGAERISVAAFAKDTRATIEGDWAAPNFEGGFSPEKRDVAPQGFKAEWAANFLRRGIPAVGADVGAIARTTSQDFSVRFTQPTNAYTGVDRALKYAMMFIGLVFLTYFMFEIVSGLRAHPAQYIMIGLSQAIFYLLLLAFAERWGFTPAFLTAAGMTVALISLYVVVVFKKQKYLIPAAVAFTGLYGLMYVLMQMEDYALIVGALTSFGALAFLMWLTRNVDWYAHSDQVVANFGGGEKSAKVE